MEIDDILNARHAADAQLRKQMSQAGMSQVNQMDNNSAFAMNSNSATTMHRPQSMSEDQNMMSYPPLSQAPSNPQMLSNDLSNDDTPEEDAQQKEDSGLRSGEAPKAFACSTCAKGFARRSDLARHERIHSGVRPHQCDHEGCGKQFIQRSALTVHVRVHTGEKPHMCERCGKPFSDSSSLARHRRIHSGKRPYKCPYANCQKTFTRRTTLTRHQQQHSGTIEQAAAETSAKLSKPGKQKHHTRQQDSEFSDAGSSAGDSGTAASPGQQPSTGSPSHEQPQIRDMHRQVPEFSYLGQNGSLPPHLRNDFQHNLSRLSPTLNAPSLSNYTSTPYHRPSTTSHPSNYAPPQPLEPPANGSRPGSPHMTGLGWGSPSHGTLPSPPAMDGFAYPDPSSYGAGHPLYYPGSNIRRPGSTEPDQYELRPRGHGGNSMGNHMNHMNHMNFMPSSAPIDWSHMPTHSNMKEERSVL